MVEIVACVVDTTGHRQVVMSIIVVDEQVV